MGQGLCQDDGGVVGVGLWAGIALLLAISAATVAFGLGGGTDDAAPEADFTYEYSQVGHGELTFVHESGDTLDPRRIEIVTDGEQFHPAPDNLTGPPSGPAYRSLGLDSDAGGGDWVDGDISAGTEFAIVGASTDSLERTTVRIVWVDPTANRTVVLDSWRGPDA